MLLKFVLRSASVTFKDPPRNHYRAIKPQVESQDARHRSGILSLSFPFPSFTSSAPEEHSVGPPGCLAVRN